MKKSRKRLLYGFVIAGAAIFLSSCTKSFCSVEDQAEMISSYAEKNLAQINIDAENKGFLVPQEEFVTFIDLKVTKYLESGVCPKDSEGNDLVSFARYAGYDENGNSVLYANYDLWVEEAKTEIGVENVPGRAYINHFKTSLKNGISGTTACITPTGGFFGLEGNERYVTGKTWGEAFSAYGPLEGLLVYPIACLLHYLTLAFGTSGGGQVIAILITTVILRAIVLLITFPATLSQTKMTELQPRLAELQQKYPNSTSNQTDKQKLAQEQMKIYKDNHVHPFMQILLMIPQFIIFICVWSALQGSAILTQGTVFNLQLTTVTYQAILSGTSETPFAIILFLLMTIAQICSTLTPQWISKWKEKNLVTRIVKVEQNSQQKTMKYVSYFMLVFIVIMGLTLPAAMGIYWLVGAIFTIVQTIILELVQRHKRHTHKGNGTKSSGGSQSWNRNKNKKKTAKFSIRRG